MTKPTILSDGSYDGHRQFFIPGEGKEFGTFVTEADVAPVTEYNKKLQGLGRDFYARDENMWHVANVPFIMLLAWAQEKGIPPDQVFGDEMAEVTKRKLNDPDFRDFKTFAGTI